MPPTLYYLAPLAGIAIFICYMCLSKLRRSPMLPPGPPGDPILGHLRHMPSDQSALVFHEWTKQYGDVMYLQVLGRPMIILDAYQAAVDLLDKGSAIYSDRPKFTLYYELLGWMPSITFLQYGKQWAKHRQMHHSYLNQCKADDFKPIQTQEARTLARNLVESTANKYEHYLSRFATGVITQIVAGHRITFDDDPYFNMSKTIFETMSRTGPPGGSPLDFFPARKWKPTLQELHDYPFRTVKKQKTSPAMLCWIFLDLNPKQENGTANPSFLLEQLEEMGDEADEVNLKGAAATMFGAGEATTWSTLTVFILAMILHPEYQAKAQKEIDSVVGDLRLPEFEDRDDLPFLECILQEVFRWNPGVPLGVPHRAMEDDIYRGMLIPKGSLVFANIKAMALDETTYSNPISFYPERYLPKPAGKGEPPSPTLHLTSAAGLICTGRYVANNNVWIVIATILASCTISNAVDDDGSIIVPENVMTDGLVRQVMCSDSTQLNQLTFQVIRVTYDASSLRGLWPRKHSSLRRLVKVVVYFHIKYMQRSLEILLVVWTLKIK
ncbi:cytochrome P450 [Mycena latifolia]|nr:cytochrome P450 [Mycena latifolia]